MVSARESKIVAERCNGGVKELKLAYVRKRANITHEYFKPTRHRISKQTNMDPMDRRNVYIQVPHQRSRMYLTKAMINYDIKHSTFLLIHFLIELSLTQVIHEK